MISGFSGQTSSGLKARLQFRTERVGAALAAIGWDSFGLFFVETVNRVWVMGPVIVEICHNTGFNEPKTAYLLAQNN